MAAAVMPTPVMPTSVMSASMMLNQGDMMIHLSKVMKQFVTSASDQAASNTGNHDDKCHKPDEARDNVEDSCPTVQLHSWLGAH